MIILEGEGYRERERERERSITFISGGLVFSTIYDVPQRTVVRRWWIEISHRSEIASLQNN